MVTRSLLQDGNLKPWEIMQHTFPELAIKLSEQRRGLGGGEYMSDAEIRRYSEWYQSLSNAERLDLARRGEL